VYKYVIRNADRISEFLKLRVTMSTYAYQFSQHSAIVAFHDVLAATAFGCKVTFSFSTGQGQGQEVSRTRPQLTNLVVDLFSRMKRRRQHSWQKKHAGLVVQIDSILNDVLLHSHNIVAIRRRHQKLTIGQAPQRRKDYAECVPQRPLAYNSKAMKSLRIRCHSDCRLQRIASIRRSSAVTSAAACKPSVLDVVVISVRK